MSGIIGGLFASLMPGASVDDRVPPRPRAVALPDAPPGAPEHAPPAVVMRGVGRTFGDFAAVTDVSLEVAEGTILGLIGPSGSGKTTVVRMLTGTLRPTSGELRVLGEEPGHFRRRTRERIGYLPQSFVLYPDLTARENVSFVAALYGLFWRRRRARVRAVLELVELWEFRDRRAGRLSGGMQRRLELACALVHEPTLLFMDEPTAGIDPVLRQTIWEELHRLRDAGRTLLITTQYVGEAEYCDRVAVLRQGRLAALDAPEALRRRALGGEVIEVETARLIDGAPLAELDGITAVRQDGPRNLFVTVADAGEATPRVLDAIVAQGGEVISSREYRPSFDDVFARLLTDGHAEPAGAVDGRDGAHP
jgi:ABC-2 type transport system ATP-binding protein